jgi:hypothetical protein
MPKYFQQNLMGCNLPFSETQKIMLTAIIVGEICIDFVKEFAATLNYY